MPLSVQVADFCAPRHQALLSLGCQMGQDIGRQEVEGERQKPGEGAYVTDYLD